MKGDNKEPLKEQMKMSFFSPPVTTTLPFVLQRDNEGGKERVCVSQQETFCWNISTLHPSLPPLFSYILTSFLLLTISRLPFLSPSAPFSLLLREFLSSTTQFHPLYIHFVALHPIILAFNSRLILWWWIQIGSKQKLRSLFQPLNRSVIMVIGHSLILEPVSLFCTSFITLEKLSLQRTTPHTASLLLRGQYMKRANVKLSTCCK